MRRAQETTFHIKYFPVKTELIPSFESHYIVLLLDRVLSPPSPPGTLPNYILLTGESRLNAFKIVNMTRLCTSVDAVLAFGERLNNILLLWGVAKIEMRDATSMTLECSFVCTTVLRSLQDILVQADTTSPSNDRIFTHAGLEEIESLVVKCDLIYRAFILLIERAAGKQSQNSAAAGNEQESLASKDLDYRTDLLALPGPEFLSSKTLGLSWKLRDQRFDGWLYRRLGFCAEQLGWVADRLLIHLQIANHARL